MNKIRELLIWTTLSIAAFLCILEIFSLPSGENKDLLFGLSAQRLLITLLPSICLLICIIAILMILITPEKYQQLTEWFRKLSSQNSIFTGVICFWTALFLGGLLFYYRLVITPKSTSSATELGHLFPTLCAYIDRLWAVLLLVAFYMACWVIYVLFILKQPLFKDKHIVVFWGAGIFSLFATFIQWLIFVFELRIFEQIPGWYWPIIVKPQPLHHALLFSIFLLIFILILYCIQRFPRAHLLNLSLICLAFIGLQYTIGVMEGRGISSLTDRFFLSYHRIYIEEACNATLTPREAIFNYEDLFPSMFLQTKPPGVLWMSFKLNQVANSPGLSSLLDQLSQKIVLSEFLPQMASAACKRSMVLTTLLFPVLATAGVWAIFGFSKWLVGGPEYKEISSYSAILFTLSPNVVMLSLFLDQSLYPSLFLITASGTLFAMQKNSFMGGFLMGAVLYGTIFLSFSMLPLLAIPIIYFACNQWQDGNFSSFWNKFKTGLLSMGLGGLCSMFLLKITLNYDIFSRYQRMMATRIEGDFYTRLGISLTNEPSTLEKIRQTWDAVILNNIELAVAIGFPVFIFFIVMGVQSVIHVVKRKPERITAINASFFLTYVALNAIRAVLGEAGRLWMFWAPVMALLAIQYLIPFIKRQRWIIYSLVIVQLLTVFLSYQFQEYLMPQLLP